MKFILIIVLLYVMLLAFQHLENIIMELLNILLSKILKN